MSLLLVSALAATTLATVPPSFGSEPYVFGLESAPASAQAQASPRPLPRLVAALGSEPLLPGFDAVPSSSASGATAVVAHEDGSSPLAASLGSEPFLPGAPPPASVTATRAAAAPAAPRERLAQSCTCG